FRNDFLPDRSGHGQGHHGIKGDTKEPLVLRTVGLFYCALLLQINQRLLLVGFLPMGERHLTARIMERVATAQAALNIKLRICCCSSGVMLKRSWRKLSMLR